MHEFPLNKNYFLFCVKAFLVPCPDQVRALVFCCQHSAHYSFKVRSSDFSFQKLAIIFQSNWVKRARSYLLFSPRPVRHSTHVLLFNTSTTESGFCCGKITWITGFSIFYDILLALVFMLFLIE